MFYKNFLNLNLKNKKWVSVCICRYVQVYIFILLCFYSATEDGLSHCCWDAVLCGRPLQGPCGLEGNDIKVSAQKCVVHCVCVLWSPEGLSRWKWAGLHCDHKAAVHWQRPSDGLQWGVWPKVGHSITLYVESTLRRAVHSTPCVQFLIIFFSARFLCGLSGLPPMSPKAGALWPAVRRESAMDTEVVLHALTNTQTERLHLKRSWSHLSFLVPLSDWEDRGRGRGRGKHIPASSSVSQATALGSNGRVMKQQSWPPHTTGDEQGGGKTRFVP